MTKSGKRILRPDEENEEEDSSDEETQKRPLPPPPRQSTTKHYMAPVNRLVRAAAKDTKEQQARIKKIVTDGKNNGSGTKSPAAAEVKK